MNITPDNQNYAVVFGGGWEQCLRSRPQNTCHPSLTAKQVAHTVPVSFGRMTYVSDSRHSQAGYDPVEEVGNDIIF